MAKTAIIYSSKRGTTKRCVQLLAERLDGGADIFDITDHSSVDLASYEAAVVGGSVYAGRLNKRLRRFLADHEAELIQRTALALFTCGMEEGEGAQRQLRESFSEPLRTKAVALECLGGEFLFSKMGWFARTLIKLAMSRDDVNQIDEAAIDRIATALNSALV
jgi:menaquinone-dependent protoporphyrinogen oxidase